MNKYLVTIEWDRGAIGLTGTHKETYLVEAVDEPKAIRTVKDHIGHSYRNPASVVKVDNDLTVKAS